MLNTDRINEIHRLFHGEHWSARKLARHLHLSRKTLRKYLQSLDYARDKRNLYAFCLIEGHSRMLYVEFTHSQSFETFVRCHLYAFEAMHGVARECWYDNLLTVVAEHVGTPVRFNPRFLAFARECGFFPRTCNPAAGWQKARWNAGV
jgi:transposase